MNRLFSRGPYHEPAILYIEASTCRSYIKFETDHGHNNMPEEHMRRVPFTNPNVSLLS